tara:strand:+ start:9105 stop:10412 length:1308 start_codon:yes stop_codon:yes gene_type:complete
MAAGTTTRAVLRGLVSENLDDSLSLTSTATGNTLTLVDTSLSEHSGGDDDFCENWYVLITESGHTAEGEVRRITGYVESTNTLTVSAAFSATTGSGSAYELHVLDPVKKHAAIKRAVSQIYPVLYLPLVDDSLIVDNRVTNGLFDTFASSSFTGWTLAGAGAAEAQETTIVWEGDNSCKLTSASAGLTQSQTINFALPIDQLIGTQAKFTCWVHATVADIAKISIDWDGGTTISSSTLHTGVDQWEELEVDVTVPAGATQLVIVLNVATGTNIGIFDRAVLHVAGNVSRYTIPAAFKDEPNQVLVQQYVSPSDGSFVPAGPYALPARGLKLRLLGRGELTNPTTETGTVEVGGSRAELLSYKATELYFQSIARSPVSSAYERNRAIEDAMYWKGVTIAKGMEPGVRMVAPPTDELEEVLHFEETASGRFLVLDGR